MISDIQPYGELPTLGERSTLQSGVLQQGDHQKAVSRTSVISDIQPYGELPNCGDSSTGATSSNVHQSGGEIIYYKETQVPSGESIYFKESEVQSGENVYFKESQVNRDGNIYFKQTNVEEAKVDNQKPGYIVEYAIPDLSKKKSRKDRTTVDENEQLDVSVVGGTLSIMV